jgi:hypothetical protein
VKKLLHPGRDELTVSRAVDSDFPERRIIQAHQLRAGNLHGGEELPKLGEICLNADPSDTFLRRPSPEKLLPQLHIWAFGRFGAFVPCRGKFDKQQHALLIERLLLIPQSLQSPQMCYFVPATGANGDCANGGGNTSAGNVARVRCVRCEPEENKRSAEGKQY